MVTLESNIAEVFVDDADIDKIRNNVTRTLEQMNMKILDNEKNYIKAAKNRITIFFAVIIEIDMKKKGKGYHLEIDCRPLVHDRYAYSSIISIYGKALNQLLEGIKRSGMKITVEDVD